MSAYLDTHVAVWLAESSLKRISVAARKQMEKTDLLVSPAVLLEIEFLYESHRIVLRADEVKLKLEHEVGVRVCSFSFPLTVNAALHEKWTRDPFDRLIVSHAKPTDSARSSLPICESRKTICARSGRAS